MYEVLYLFGEETKWVSEITEDLFDSRKYFEEGESNFNEKTILKNLKTQILSEC